MAFVPKASGDWELFYPTKTASVAFAIGMALDWPASPTGYISPASSTTNKFAGICQYTITSSSANYALNTQIPALRPIRPSVILIALTASATAANVGGRYDLTDANTVNVGASSVGRVIVDEYYSATSIGVHFLAPALTGAS